MESRTLLQVALDPQIKAEAEAILAELGLPLELAVQLFYRQIIEHRGLPFSVILEGQADGFDGDFRDEKPSSTQEEETQKQELSSVEAIFEQLSRDIFSDAGTGKA